MFCLGCFVGGEETQREHLATKLGLLCPLCHVKESAQSSVGMENTLIALVGKSCFHTVKEEIAGVRKEEMHAFDRLTQTCFRLHVPSQDVTVASSRPPRTIEVHEVQQLPVSAAHIDRSDFKNCASAGVAGIHTSTFMRPSSIV